MRGAAPVLPSPPPPPAGVASRAASARAAPRPSAAGPHAPTPLLEAASRNASGALTPLDAEQLPAVSFFADFTAASVDGGRLGASASASAVASAQRRAARKRAHAEREARHAEKHSAKRARRSRPHESAEARAERRASRRRERAQRAAAGARSGDAKPRKRRGRREGGRERARTNSADAPRNGHSGADPPLFEAAAAPPVTAASDAVEQSARAVSSAQSSLGERVALWVDGVVAARPPLPVLASRASSAPLQDESAISAKVTAKVLAEWHSKARHGVDVDDWLTSNPKRRQQVAALIDTYRTRRTSRH